MEREEEEEEDEDDDDNEEEVLLLFFLFFFCFDNPPVTDFGVMPILHIHNHIQKSAGNSQKRKERERNNGLSRIFRLNPQPTR